MNKKSSATSEVWIDALVWFCGIVLVSAMLNLVYQMVAPGLTSIRWNYLIAEPLNSGRGGGIFSVVVSTLWILGVAMTVAAPIGVASAVWLSEFTPSQTLLTRAIRRSLDVLAGVPSIVFGLFGSAFFCRFLGFGFSILSGGLTLACMVLPILIRSTEVGLRSVPAEYRLSANALALSKRWILFRLILPAAVPGLVVGLILGLSRAIAETAALIFTSGYVDRMPSSVMDSGRALSVHIFDLSMNVPGGEPNAYKSTLVIMMLILILNSGTMAFADRLLGRRIVIL